MALVCHSLKMSLFLPFFFLTGTSLTLMFVRQNLCSSLRFHLFLIEDVNYLAPNISDEMSLFLIFDVGRSLYAWFTSFFFLSIITTRLITMWLELNCLSLICLVAINVFWLMLIFSLLLTLMFILLVKVT